MKKLIVIVDLGHIRSICFREAGDDPAEKEHLAEAGRLREHQPPTTRSAVATDQSGRFAQGGPAGGRCGMSYGEEHNLELDLEHRALRDIAARIADIVREEGKPPWILAAPQAILPRLERALPKECRDCLTETVGGDLTKEPLAALEERFLSEA